MNNINPKVTAATFSAAVVTVVLYFLNMIPTIATMDDFTKAALGVILTGLATFAAGYATSANTGGDHRADA